MITENLPDTNNIAALALGVAIGQVGQQEEPKGSNSGPMVDQYLHSVGLHRGYAWCQAFVHWCYDQAAQQGGRANPVAKTAGVHDCWNKAGNSSAGDPGNHFRKVTKSEAVASPQLVTPGCQFILLFGNGAGHTGLVEKLEGTALYTVEGNSNNNGSREGYEVVRHKRSLTDEALAGFICYS